MASSGPFPSRSAQLTCSFSLLASVGPVDDVVFFRTAAPPLSPGTVLSSFTAFFLRPDSLHASDPIRYDTGSPKSTYNGHLYQAKLVTSGASPLTLWSRHAIRQRPTVAGHSSVTISTNFIPATKCVTFGRDYLRRDAHAHDIPLHSGDRKSAAGITSYQESPIAYHKSHLR